MPVANRLGAEGGGFKLAMAALDGGRIGIAAQAVGIGRAALEASVRYARERQTFGVPIGQHQMIQWMLADMATGVDAARLLTWRAAVLKDRRGHVVEHQEIEGGKLGHGQRMALGRRGDNCVAWVCNTPEITRWLSTWAESNSTRGGPFTSTMPCKKIIFRQRIVGRLDQELVVMITALGQVVAKTQRIGARFQAQLLLDPHHAVAQQAQPRRRIAPAFEAARISNPSALSTGAAK